VTGPDTREGELKLHGAASLGRSDLRGAARAWWPEHPKQAFAFTLRIAMALFIE